MLLNNFWSVASPSNVVQYRKPWESCVSLCWWGGETLKEEIIIDFWFSHNLQDFEDITAQPSLEEKMETEDPLEDQLEVDRALLSKSSMQTVMMVHQKLCLNFARSLWYQQSLPSHQAKHYFSTFISCYQTGACLVSQFYPLIGKIASNISDVQV